MTKDTKKMTPEESVSPELVESSSEQVSAEQGDTKDLASQLAACTAAVTEWQDKYLRVNADIENFRRRVAKDQALWKRNAQIELLLPLLSIVDDFDRAFEKPSAEQSQEIVTCLEGFILIHKSLQKYLMNAGVTEMNNFDRFDPEYHEALVQVDSPDHETGQIVAVLQKGYLFKEAVLRPAKVSVAK